MRSIPPTLLAACVVALAPIPARAGTPSVAEMIAMAPTIRSLDEKVKSIEVAGYVRDHGKIVRTFRALYRAPDRFAFVVRDGQDGTPISVAVDKKLMIYDPVKPEVLVQPHASSYQTFQGEAGDFREYWGFTTSGREPCRIEVDLKSIVTAPTKGGAPARESVTEESPGVHVLTLTSQGAKASRRLRVDRRGPTPLVTFEMAPTRGGPPTFGIDRLIVNGDLDDSEFVFPSLDKLAGTLKVEEVKDGFFSEFDAMKMIARTYYVRQKLREPKSERGLITPLLAGVRFSQVEANEEKYAKLVRDLIPADPIRRAIELPGPPDEDPAVKQTRLEAIRDRLPHFPYKFKLRLDSKSDDRS